ncbi:MAG: hypothetical protein QOH90_492 [Actinomycetota bacterium]|jgi:photosystem II stability/assembly factor-like uncharacterized protein|nr:hypothetical protein [Actinomycetota bacterium]
MFSRVLFRRPKTALALVLTFALVGSALAYATTRAGSNIALGARACPAGTSSAFENEPNLDPSSLPAEYRGPQGEFPEWIFGGCVPRDHGETFRDLAMRDLQASSIRSAPLDYVPDGAPLAAAREREALLRSAARVPGATGTAKPYGKGPLIFTDERYDEANGTGIVHGTGRIDDLKYDPVTNRMFAAIGTGGVWMSTNLGKSWRPLTDKLPSTITSSAAYTKAGGPDGTIIALTGEHTFGGDANEGIGAFYSRNLGRTWKRSKGVPSGALGFATEVDPQNPKVVYVATGKGLWRSADAGETFKDVKLPTGKCQADYSSTKCHFANFVTDVVVKAPKGVGADTKGTDVVAVVGWRAGQAEDPQGFVQSPMNGIYKSATGKPGSFKYQDGLATAAGGQERIGRVELGPAVGSDQDHDYLYAVVEDAVLFNGGFRAVDVNEQDPAGLFGLDNPTVFNGAYVSADFGETWTQLANDTEMSQVCPANKSVYCIPGLIEPGAQAWYNEWIAPDPTKAVGGVPSRVLMGLEEVWQTQTPNQIPQNTQATKFEVVGAYYGSADCLLAATNCSANKQTDVNTTHPDQHSAVFVPAVDDEETGNVTLFVGNDGGLAHQDATQTDDFDQNSWQLTQKNGLYTLLPYSAIMANDGVVYAGLQDNGTMRINPKDDFKQFETIGADGTIVAVDPKNSDYAFESVQYGAMNVTTDGGQTWRDVEPPADEKRFVSPFVMDPLNKNHIVAGGQQINETLFGPDTTTVCDTLDCPPEDDSKDWLTVFDLGTADPLANPKPETPDPPPNVQTAIDTRGDVSYVGFCGPCDVLNSPYPFKNGIATNIGGDKPAKAGTPDGWHKVKTKGLPNRYITSLAIDPRDKSTKTVYATLGGYSRPWVGPGDLNDPNKNIGKGHVFKSVDGGVHWTNVSGNLPDAPALWVQPKGKQLLVGSDQGAFISSNTRSDSRWAPLRGIPATPVPSIHLKPNDHSIAVIGTFGRGVWTYKFGTTRKPPASKLLQPFVRMSPSNTTPRRGTLLTFKTRIFGCTKSARALKALAGTKVELQRKKNGEFVTLKQKRTNDECRAVFRSRANFKEATFRAFWPKQHPRYRKGNSEVSTITTH